MFARLTLINLGQGQRETAEKVANEFNAFAKTLNGCKGLTFFSDESAGEYGGFSLWETEADAKAAGEKFNPRIAEMLGNQLKAEPSIRIFEVFEATG